jgi:hypothetical protein
VADHLIPASRDQHLPGFDIAIDCTGRVVRKLYELADLGPLTNESFNV